MDKKIILAIVLTMIIMFAIIGSYVLYKNYDNKKLKDVYSLGYNQSLQDMAQGQTNSGSILIWQNNSIQVMSIQDICNGVVE